MADNKKNQTIIIKKIQGGHAGAHGGAWKVAYADFVTAMMAFFMVMWLLGADEETKQAVADYFNNPVSALRPDLSNRENIPLGDQTGAGEALLKGAEGDVPSDLVDRPSRPYVTQSQVAETPGKILEDLLADDRRVVFDTLSFSIAEDAFFVRGSMTEWAPGGAELVRKLGRLVHKHQGRLEIATEFERTSQYEFQLSRAVRLGQELVARSSISEDRVVSRAQIRGGRGLASASESEGGADTSADAASRPRRVRLVLKR